MKLESLENTLFTKVKKSQLKEIKGGGPTATDGKGRISLNGAWYDWNGDFDDKEGGRFGYIVPEKGLIWVSYPE